MRLATWPNVIKLFKAKPEYLPLANTEPNEALSTLGS